MMVRGGILLACVAGAALAGAAPAAPPVAYRPVGRTVESAMVPGMRVEVAAGFRPLPVLRFPIGDMTDAERHVFVEPGADGRPRRMVILQFERVQAGSAFRFVFPARPPYVFGAATYRSGTYVYDDEAAARAAPGREAERTRALLAAEGLAPPRLWRTARLARVADPQGLSEVILFYMENADGAFGPGPLPGADEDGDLPLEGADRAAMLERLSTAIRAVRG